MKTESELGLPRRVEGGTTGQRNRHTPGHKKTSSGKEVLATLGVASSEPSAVEQKGPKM
jgi:hypothetical protein